MMPWRPLLILSSFLFLQAFAAEAESEHAANRKPRLFYVSTQVNTFTYTTNSVCVLSTTSALATCTKKKKRQMELNELEELNDDIEPSEVSFDEEMPVVRQPKFLQYWMTTTSTMTITTFSATSTMFSLQCTPSNFPLAVCGR